MTSKADISVGNWAALVDAAPAIARAVSASGGNADRSVKELDAFIQFVSDAATGGQGGALVEQLIADISGRLAAGVEPASSDAYTDGLELARRAGAILAVEVEPNEATGIRAWYLAAASRVAEAARDGGVLGIGSTEVSDWERDTLQALAEALGADAPADTPFEPPAAPR